MERRIYRFGIFELDSGTLELRKDGRKEPKLRDQALQVLVALLDRPKEIVTREDLQRQLWPQDTFVDFDHGLNTAINQLRNALGDSATNPRFIQTLPRRGYRFIAPVEVDGDEPGHLKPPTSVQAAIEEGAAAAPTERIDAISRLARNGVLSDGKELPNAPRSTVRVLFSLIQVMYLGMYAVSLARLSKVETILTEKQDHATLILIVLIVTACVGIPVRLYLLSAVAFNYGGLKEKFLRLFPLFSPWTNCGRSRRSCWLITSGLAARLR